MIIPAAMFIEAAMDQLKELDPDVRAKELKELYSALGAQSTEEVQLGYLLGIQTARVLLSGMINAVKNNVTI